jgi:hypothetical protein
MVKLVVRIVGERGDSVVARDLPRADWRRIRRKTSLAECLRLSSGSGTRHLKSAGAATRGSARDL